MPKTKADVREDLLFKEAVLAALDRYERHERARRLKKKAKIASGKKGSARGG